MTEVVEAEVPRQKESHDLSGGIRKRFIPLPIEVPKPSPPRSLEARPPMYTHSPLRTFGGPTMIRPAELPPPPFLFEDDSFSPQHIGRKPRYELPPPPIFVDSPAAPPDFPEFPAAHIRGPKGRRAVEEGGRRLEEEEERATSPSAASPDFPADFYPPTRVQAILASSRARIKRFLYDQNTLFMLVLIMAVASGMLAGMAFFNPQSPVYAAISQLCRVYASLWCLLIPLFRDRTLPVWPTRGWLYGSVVMSAVLSVLSVALCGVDARWSGLVACIGDFAALAATVLLAMVVVHSVKGRTA
ncbi:hypothetical protein TWF696_005504 [Orbilia brochopaga]|uniref:Uncharacterized protein n=1 Tax=Orbilia brochopaga TaxID=3140254 RepID=A0AAV9V137_9PEZI